MRTGDDPANHSSNTLSTPGPANAVPSHAEPLLQYALFPISEFSDLEPSTPSWRGTDRNADAADPCERPDVMVVDDHPLYRDALISSIKRTSGRPIEVLAAFSAEEALRLARINPQITLVFLDLRLPGLQGNEVLAPLRRALPAASVVVLSASEQRREIDAALRAGARAFVSKSVPRSVLEDTIRRALNAELLPSEVIAQYPRAPLPQAGVSLRQRQVLSLLSKGHSNKEIGLQLGVEEITVKQHVTKILKALGVTNRTQAVLASRGAGLELE